MAKEKVTAMKAVKGEKVNTVIFTKTVEVEKDFNEILDDERRLFSYIEHIKQELVRAERDYAEILQMKLDLGI